MTSRRPLILAVAAAAAARPGRRRAGAASRRSQFDRACYAERPVRWPSPAPGYTPGGEVELLVSDARPVACSGRSQTTADAAGAISGSPAVAGGATCSPTARTARCLGVTANDRTRIDQGAEPASQFGRVASSRSRAGSASRPAATSPGRKAAVETYGWAFAAGQAAVLPASARAGRSPRSAPAPERGTAATSIARIKVPRKLRPGAYRLVLSTERRRPARPLHVAQGSRRQARRRPPRRAARRGDAPRLARRGPQLRPPHGGGGRGPS